MDMFIGIALITLSGVIVNYLMENLDNPIDAVSIISMFVGAAIGYYFLL